VQDVVATRGQRPRQLDLKRVAGEVVEVHPHDRRAGPVLSAFARPDRQ
jgi:hypothetical protein